jgi:hypothetical protein
MLRWGASSRHNRGPGINTYPEPTPLTRRRPRLRGYLAAAGHGGDMDGSLFRPGAPVAGRPVYVNVN